MVYRLRISPITDEVELSEITEALSISDDVLHDHLDKALGYLSDRENPDYANSIKESITAVEYACNKITGEKNTTLGSLLKHIDKRGENYGVYNKY